VKRRRGRRRAIGTRAPPALPLAINKRWSLDFVSHQLVNGRRFRVLAVSDDFNSKCLVTLPDAPLPGLRDADDAARQAGKDRVGQRYSAHEQCGTALDGPSSRSDGTTSRQAADTECVR